MDEIVREYVAIRDQISALEAKKKKLSEHLKAGLSFLGTNVTKVELDGKFWKVGVSSRDSRSCMYDLMKELFPDAYDRCVKVSTTEFIEVRAVKNGD